jgi:hypothetical protein
MCLFTRTKTYYECTRVQTHLHAPPQTDESVCVRVCTGVPCTPATHSQPCVYEETVGSCLQELLGEGVFPGETATEQLRLAFESFDVWRKTRKVTCSQAKFTPAMVGLKGPHVYPSFNSKAYNTRCVVGWLEEVCTYVAERQNTMHSRRRAACVHFLAQYFARTEAHGRYLDAQAASQISEALNSAVTNFASLAAEAVEQGRVCWHILPKTHLMSHLADFVLEHRLNPRFFHTFRDEDEMGLFKSPGPSKPLFGVSAVMKARGSQRAVMLYVCCH